MAEMKKQYLVGVQQRYQQKDELYTNLATYCYGIKRRYFTSLDEAKMELKKFIEKNDPKKKVYGTDGKRYESGGSAGGIGISVQSDKDTDRDMEVVDWYIKEREVTPWEKIEVEL